jgi:hypothetical protein
VSVLTQPVGGTASLPPVLPPTNTSLPTVSGTSQEGQTLTATAGSWSGDPTGYSYQWRRCDGTGANCASISSATSASYNAQTADVASTLRVVVTASNTAGPVSATSAATAVVAAAPTAPPPPPASTQTLTFSGSLNPQNSSRTFSVAVGAGVAQARLSFQKCKTLALGLSNGASANGPSVIALDATLTSGTYSYTVSGGRCSFTLTLTTATP